MSDSEKEVGRNEPCPCGSGKKYKRCHGVGAAPKLGAPKPSPFGPGGMPGTENMDPAAMMQMAQALQRLPRPQMQKLQSIMQKAMAGKDVTREAEELEKILPPEFKAMVSGMGMQGAMAQAQQGEVAPLEASTDEMSEEEARAIIEKAAQEGKISQDKAEQLLQADESKGSEEEPSNKKSFWKGLTGR